MLLLGVIYRALSEFTRGRLHDPVALAVYGALVWPLLNGFEGTFAGSLLGVLKMMLLFGVAVVGIQLVLSPTRRATHPSVSPPETRSTAVTR